MMGCGGASDADGGDSVGYVHEASANTTEMKEKREREMETMR